MMSLARTLIGLVWALTATAAIAAVNDNDSPRPGAPRHTTTPHSNSAARASRERADSARDNVESLHEAGEAPNVDSRPSPSGGARETDAARSRLRNLLDTRAQARGPIRQMHKGNPSRAQPDSRQAGGATQLRSPRFSPRLVAAASTVAPVSFKPTTSLHVMPATGQPARIASRVRVPEHGGTSHTGRIDGSQVHRGF
jgi:hypothetical protein